MKSAAARVGLPLCTTTTLGGPVLGRISGSELDLLCLFENILRSTSHLRLTTIHQISEEFIGYLAICAGRKIAKAPHHVLFENVYASFEYTKKLPSR